ncbi:hypothetical protein C6B37_02315 [Candidatus Phytoplasma phoenicium]|uniref:Uncharacterized protein n=1 Tax=Candidatus Phytoplasma phoenicium TaxID=198422 RepID=A0A2S8NTN2_9MOLU|nr:hypothetical protein C6B37_02315 [Candidatus Phytoplasma phoenicium]
MVNEQKCEKEYHEYCQCCGHSLGIDLSNKYFNLFGSILGFMTFFSVSIWVLYLILSIFLVLFFHILIFNKEFFYIFNLISLICSFLFCLICQFKPQLLFKKADYIEKIEKE